MQKEKKILINLTPEEWKTTTPKEKSFFVHIMNNFKEDKELLKKTPLIFQKYYEKNKKNPKVLGRGKNIFVNYK